MSPLARRVASVPSHVLIYRRETGLRFYGGINKKPYEPLRVLFCGADHFSIYSLDALYALHRQKPERIASIDVVCRPGKRVGRGLKHVLEGKESSFLVDLPYTELQAHNGAVPIKNAATQLGLSVHQIDTFTGWTPPTPIDLIIAVSFGLLVPPRILNGAKYGGLNVHPSLLPDLRGPAPLQHTLLQRRSHTGLSLQTLHPKHFDQGLILAQTPPPGVLVPDDCTPDDLLKILGPMGACMLTDAIGDGLFVSPVCDMREGMSGLREEKLAHAPKVTPECRRIDWKTWTADEIMLRDRVLGRLWDSETYAKCSASDDRVKKRVTFTGPWTKHQSLEDIGVPSAGDVALHVDGSEGSITLGIATTDGQTVVPASATIEGEKKAKGLLTLVQRLRSTPSV